MTDMADVKVGFLLWPQTDSWPTLRDAAVRAEGAGASSLWTWDHLMSIVGPWEGPILEGWSVLTGWAGVTERATLGLMVGANTFRNPGLTAKLAITLDHQSNGRAILGIGGAWFEREHDAYGIDFGSGFGERLDRLDESVMLARRLFDGERFSHDGPIYPMHDALAAPRPVQEHLPIMIGGSGPKKTLRTLAKYGDMWNTGGSTEQLAKKLGTLRERCAEIGRDPETIEKTASVDLVLRDTREAALRTYGEIATAGGFEADLEDAPHVGTPEQVADNLRPIVDLGFRHIIVDMPAPYDAETIDRIGEVMELLRG
jgi:alkanesulfonate monooxygenase SsuD/methylene tetrahydromethanopterin reductase-like flavin-dependent oxidoreductase (luciferase family)